MGEAQDQNAEEVRAVAHYVVVLVTPKADAWIPDYLKAVGPLVEKHGGKYLARTTSHERLYEPHLKARLTGAANDLFLVEGKDDFA